MIQEKLSVNTIRLAKVTYVHPEGQKMEVIFLDNGDYGRDVQLMTPYGGTDFGFTSGLPQPEEEGHEENKITDPDKRDIIAVVAMTQGCYIALGFLYPQITHMAFTKENDPGRMIERHTSDFYRTVDSDANMEMVHPSGAWINMATNVEPTQLAGRDFDERWELKRNINGQISLTLANYTGGGETKVILKPGGEIEIYASSTINMEAGESITLKAPTIVDDTPLHFTTGVHKDAIGIHY